MGADDPESIEEYAKKIMDNLAKQAIEIEELRDEIKAKRWKFLLDLRAAAIEEGAFLDALELHPQFIKDREEHNELVKTYARSMGIEEPKQ